MDSTTGMSCLDFRESDLAKKNWDGEKKPFLCIQGLKSL